MSYYDEVWGWTAEFTLLDWKKPTGIAALFPQKLAHVYYRSTKTAAPLTLKSSRPPGPAGYPSYEIVTIKGITEVIEHRQMEPLFYITDDPAVLSELGVSH